MLPINCFPVDIAWRQQDQLLPQVYRRKEGLGRWQRTDSTGYDFPGRCLPLVGTGGWSAAECTGNPPTVAFVSIRVNSWTNRRGRTNHSSPSRGGNS